ncbi:hypothetical protein GALL_488070 [mine drainage metagenome]|uniref:Uncharacterized protein n=1 Tax=mine drainage metagenome TaxID=410659 RepID=A0A1J5PE09_9ZZZZ
MHQQAFAARAFVDELADRLEERQALDIANGAADFAKHEIDLIFTDVKEVFDFIGDVRDDLNGFAEVVATALFFQHVRIDATRGHRVGLAGMDASKALVVAEVEVGFGAVVGDEHLAMLKGRHRAGIDVEIGVEFAQADREAARLQQRTKGGGGETLAQRGNHPAGDKNITCHADGPP